MLKIGQRINIELNSYELTSHWDTPFGPIYLYTFRDFFNNTFIWKTPQLIEENIYSITGRIKGIERFNNQNEFVLTYCKVNC